MASALIERVAEIIPRYSMAFQGASIGVAVSGGADSVVLLHILHRLQERLGLRLMVLHVNHHLRPTESDADEVFVREMSRELDLPISVEEGAVLGGNLEQTAREKRREFFIRSRELRRLDRIALGHTRSDQAETVLHRLLRGAGPSGLSAMQFVTDEGLIRPLLTSSRAEVREWAAAQEISWREDSSNADLRFTRNRLRMETLPSLTMEYNPNLEAVLAGTAEVMETEESYWKEKIGTLYGQLVKRTRLGLVFQVSDLLGQHLAVRRRLVRFALEQLRAEALRGLDFQHVEAILTLCRSTQGHDRVLVPGADALRSFDSLLLSLPGTLSGEERHYQVELRPGEEKTLPFGSGYICFSPITPGGEVCDNFKKAQEIGAQSAELDWKALAGKGPLVVRNWEPGDKFIRKAQKPSEKIKTLFQEHRVRLWERRHWPVVLCEGEIVWVRDFGPADKFRHTAEGTEVARLTYREDASVP